MASAGVATNGTGGSSGMEVDAAGNGPRGGGFWRPPSRGVKAFLGSAEKSGGRDGSIAPGITCGRDVWPRLCCARSHLPGRT